MYGKVHAVIQHALISRILVLKFDIYLHFLLSIKLNLEYCELFYVCALVKVIDNCMFTSATCMGELMQSNNKKP